MSNNESCNFYHKEEYLEPVPFETEEDSEKSQNQGFSSIIIFGLTLASLLLSKVIPVLINDVIVPAFHIQQIYNFNLFISPILSELCLILIPLFSAHCTENNETIKRKYYKTPNNLLQFVIFLIAFCLLSFSLLSPNSCKKEIAKAEMMFKYFSNTKTVLLVTILTDCIFPAICEEYLFRAWMMHFLEEDIGIKYAVIIQSIVFSLCHPFYSIYSYIIIIFLAVCWTYANIQTESIFVSLFSHIVHNFINVTLIFIYPNVCNNSPNFSFVLWFVSTFLLLCLYSFDICGNHSENYI